MEEMLLFLVQNEEQIFKELTARTKYYPLFRFTSDVYAKVVAEYVKECFPFISGEDRLLIMEDLYIKNLISYLEGKHKNEHAH